LETYKAYIEQIKEERYRFLTEGERERLDNSLLDVIYDIQMFWRKVEQMQIEYAKLK